MNESEKIRIVFTGEYSTGKSSIIKALTGREDIEIEEIPTTNTAIKYDYNGLCIVDTPGLNSGNEVHDKIAKKELAKADVIIFCLTANNLFTLEARKEFEDLIGEESVLDKLIICINKIDLETKENILDYFGNLEDSVEEVLDETSSAF